MKKFAWFALVLSLLTLAYVVWQRVGVVDGPPTEIGTSAVRGPDARPSASGSAASGATPPREAEIEDAGDASVAGIVVAPFDVFDRPRPGVEVRLLRATAPWPRPRTELVETVSTGSDGTFRFRTRRGPDLFVEVRGRDFAKVREPAPEDDPMLRVVLRPGHSVRGQVFDPANRPLTNCEVCLEPNPGSRRQGESTRTDSRGFFAFPGVTPGVVRLTARHPDFQPASLPTVTVGTGYAVLKFGERGFELRGQVVATGNGAPIAQATLRLYPNAWNGGLHVPLETTTDEQGRFVLSGLGPGNVQLEVRHPDYSTATPVLSLREPVTEKRLELFGRSTVRGRVASPRSAAGLVLGLTTSGGEIAETTVAPDGTFTFAGRFSGGTATLSLRGDRFVVAQRGGREVQVEITEDVETTLELSLDLPAVVQGRVLDAEGAPAAGVRIGATELRRVPQAEELFAGVTDRDGRFALRTLPAGPIKLNFVLGLSGLGSAQVTVPPPGGELTLPDVRLAEPATISGRIQRGTSGLEGALVFASRGQDIVAVEVTGARGRFRIRGLPAGEYRVRAHYSTLPVVHGAELLSVSAGERIDDVVLQIPAGRQLTGVVEDLDGQPVREAIVRVPGAPGAYMKLDGSAGGRFRLEVPDTDVEIEVLVEELETMARRTVRRDESNVLINVALPPRGVLRTRVLSLRGRRPVPFVLYSAEPTDVDADTHEAIRRQRRVVTRGRELNGGELELIDFPAGRSRLVVTAPGFVPAVIDVDLPANAVVDLPPVLLESGATLRGRVLDPTGRPVADARVHLGSEGELAMLPKRGACLTGDDGVFTISGIGPGATRLTIVADGFAPLHHEIAVPDDLLRAEPLALTLGLGGELAVRIVDEHLKPRELELVLLRRDGLPIANGYTDEKGEATFRLRAPGSYEIALPMHRQGTTTAEVTPGAPSAPTVLQIVGKNPPR